MSDVCLLTEHNITARAWTAPGVASQTAALPAAPAGFAPNPLARLAGGILSATGHWANADVWVNVDASWSDVVFELVARVGPCWAVLARKTLDDMGNATAVGGGRMGLLFSVRGRPCDEFKVRAYPTAIDHPQGEFRMTVWGADGPTYGDQTTRQPIDLFATPAQLLSFTTGLVGLVVGAPNLVFAANPSGGRIAITHLSWTTTDAPVRSITLQEVVGAAAPVVRKVWFKPVDRDVLEDWTVPFFSARGARWEVVLSAGAAGAHLLNVSGFNE